MAHVSRTMWRIRNQPSNSTSCSVNALRLLVLVTGLLYWGLQVMSTTSILGLRFEGLFRERNILKGQIVFEGHWRLQSWTLLLCRNQCSRLKPSYEFHFGGLSNFRPSVEGLVQIQDVNLRIIEMKYKTHIKLVHELLWYMFPIQCEELRINYLTPLFVVTMPYTCGFLWWADCIEDFKWHLHFANLGLRFEELFRERYILKGHIAFEGIEDFNLEHCLYVGTNVQGWSPHMSFVLKGSQISSLQMKG